MPLCNSVNSSENSGGKGTQCKYQKKFKLCRHKILREFKRVCFYLSILNSKSRHDSLLHALSRISEQFFFKRIKHNRELEQGIGSRELGIENWAFSLLGKFSSTRIRQHEGMYGTKVKFFPPLLTLTQQFWFALLVYGDDITTLLISS